MNGIFQGLFNNILIAVLSSILPIILGGLMLVVCKNNEYIRQGVQLISLVFESICPMLAIMLLYFCGVIGRPSVQVAVVLAFSVSFIGYIPKRYDANDSLMKNFLVNSVGVVSSILKWSVCASFIGAREILQAARQTVAMTFNTDIYWTVFALLLIVVFALEFVRYLLKENLR